MESVRRLPANPVGVTLPPALVLRADEVIE